MVEISRSPSPDPPPHSLSPSRSPLFNPSVAALPLAAWPPAVVTFSSPSGFLLSFCLRTRMQKMLNDSKPQEEPAKPKAVVEAPKAVAEVPKAVGEAPEEVVADTAPILHRIQEAVLQVSDMSRKRNSRVFVHHRHPCWFSLQATCTLCV